MLRRWKNAAGPLAGRHVPSAPFTALALYGEPRLSLRERPDPRLLDRVCRSVAEQLSQTEQAVAVRQGEAAFVIDLPAALAAGLGLALQPAGIAPVLLFNGLYRPDGLLTGRESLPALVRYGRQLSAWRGESGLAFLLERDRGGPDNLDDLSAWRAFENRYRVGDHLFPSLTRLKEAGPDALIDLRLEADELPDDLNSFYRYAARSGFDIYQATLPSAWFNTSTLKDDQ